MVNGLQWKMGRNGAVKAALLHPKGAGLSDRQIAEHVGVDHKTVARFRGELQATGEIPQSDSRTGKDGRTIDTSNIGKAAARIRPMFEAAAKERQKLAEGGDRKSEAVKENQGRAKRATLDKAPKSRASEQAAAALNVSRQSVDRANICAPRFVSTAVDIRAQEVALSYCGNTPGKSTGSDNTCGNVTTSVSIAEKSQTDLLTFRLESR